MNWYPGEALRGSIIRINLGSVYHYGIFVSEDDIIQFGYPPLPKYKMPSEEIRVLSTDIDIFSCGKIVEVASFTKEENKKRFSDEEIVSRARESLGRDGYNLLHNNCEHFVYFCAFGKPFCTVEDEALRRWRSRPVFDIYIMPVNDSEIRETFSCRKREEEHRSVADLPERKVKMAAWTLLETALGHSFKLNADEIEFRKDIFGKWFSERCFFSVAHSEDYAAVAVSGKNCGLDFELTEGREKDLSILKEITKKNSLIKLNGKKFLAEKKKNKTVSAVFEYPGMVISYCGEDSGSARFFLVKNNKPGILGGGIFER